jgi:hypothetical protein
MSRTDKMIRAIGIACVVIFVGIIGIQFIVATFSSNNTSNSGSTTSGDNAGSNATSTSATGQPDLPTHVVAAFYDAISRKDFTTAWNLLSPTFQSDGSFDKFRDGYATTQSVRVSVAEVPGAPQKVRATLDATDLINGNTVHSHFEGWWVLAQASDGHWLLDNGHFTKTRTDAPSPDEIAFLASKDAAAARFDNAPNDMVKHQIAGVWRNGGTCSALKTATFTNWTGTIAKIYYDGDLYVDLGDNVTLDASIDTASPLFKVVSTMKEGDAVEVSGAFDDQVLNDPSCMANPRTTDLLDEDTGTVKTPRFGVTLSRIAPHRE